MAEMDINEVLAHLPQRYPVLMIDRPPSPTARVTHEVGEVLDWLHHGADRGV